MEQRIGVVIYLVWDDHSSLVASPVGAHSMNAGAGIVDREVVPVGCSVHRTTRSARSCSRDGGRGRIVCRVLHHALSVPVAGYSQGNTRRTV